MLLYRYSCRCAERPAGNTAGGKVLEKLWAEITNSVNSEVYDDSYSLTLPLKSCEKNKFVEFLYVWDSGKIKFPEQLLPVIGRYKDISCCVCNKFGLI